MTGNQANRRDARHKTFFHDIFFMRSEIRTIIWQKVKHQHKKNNISIKCAIETRKNGGPRLANVMTKRQ